MNADFRHALHMYRMYMIVSCSKHTDGSPIYTQRVIGEAWDAYMEALRGIYA